MSKFPTYKDIARTLEIMSQHFERGMDKECFEIYGEHDVVVFSIPKETTIGEIRELARMGWSVGFGETDEEDSEKWRNHESISDDELMELFSRYWQVYMFT
jgi:hypothetical protein